MYFYSGSEEFIYFSGLLPCCMTGFLIPVITDYTWNQAVLRHLHPDLVNGHRQATGWDAISAGQRWSVGYCGDGLKLLLLRR